MFFTLANGEVNILKYTLFLIQFNGEATLLKPVMFDRPQKKIEQMYSYPLIMFFTRANGELILMKYISFDNLMGR